MDWSQRYRGSNASVFGYGVYQSQQRELRPDWDDHANEPASDCLFKSTATGNIRCSVLTAGFSKWGHRWNRRWNARGSDV